MTHRTSIYAPFLPSFNVSCLHLPKNSSMRMSVVDTYTSMLSACCASHGTHATAAYVGTLLLLVLWLIATFATLFRTIQMKKKRGQRRLRSARKYFLFHATFNALIATAMYTLLLLSIRPWLILSMTFAWSAMGATIFGCILFFHLLPLPLMREHQTLLVVIGNFMDWSIKLDFVYFLLFSVTMLIIDSVNRQHEKMIRVLQAFVFVLSFLPLIVMPSTATMLFSISKVSTNKKVASVRPFQSTGKHSTPSARSSSSLLKINIIRNIRLFVFLNMIFCATWMMISLALASNVFISIYDANASCRWHPIYVCSIGLWHLLFLKHFFKVPRNKRKYGTMPSKMKKYATVVSAVVRFRRNLRQKRLSRIDDLPLRPSAVLDTLKWKRRVSRVEVSINATQKMHTQRTQLMKDLNSLFALASLGQMNHPKNKAFLEREGEHREHRGESKTMKHRAIRRTVNVNASSPKWYAKLNQRFENRTRPGYHRRIAQRPLHILTLEDVIEEARAARAQEMGIMHRLFYRNSKRRTIKYEKYDDTCRKNEEEGIQK